MRIKMKTYYQLLAFTGLMCLGLHQPAIADEQTNVDENGFSGYTKLGLGYRYEKGPYEDKESVLSLFISGRYQHTTGLFAEISHGANELQQGVNLGYSFYQ